MPAFSSNPSRKFLLNGETKLLYSAFYSSLDESMENSKWIFSHIKKKKINNFFNFICTISDQISSNILKLLLPSYNLDSEADIFHNSPSMRNTCYV